MLFKYCTHNVLKKLGFMHTKQIHDYMRIVIGNRDVVGYGYNGLPCYMDRVDYPFPALRWRETTPEIMALREKEKGDWKCISLDDKKKIYRTNYCQTIAEINAPTGNWKCTFAGVLFVVTGGIWLFILLHLCVYQPFRPLPESFSEENKRIQMRRMLDLHVNPIHGLSSKWDYENDVWKK
ncbi:hypothetical protein FQR65_LT04028 [Abscondita terminalis]|nr:hypothetical protein FQR65_LT04028 [Abscondita terminalis]